MKKRTQSPESPLDLLARLQRDYAELAITIRVLEERVQSGTLLQERVAALRTRRPKMFRRLETMVDRHARNGRPKARAHQRLPKVDPIPNLSVKGMKLAEAIPAVLSAAKRKMVAGELTAILRKAGQPHRHIHGVRILASRLAREKKIKRSKTGLLSV
jgi:hypothetical protein